MYTVTATTQFFIATLLVFIAHCLWLAINAGLLPYDEYYHLGVIKVYATQLSPFLTTQPAEASAYGDVTRLAYLYHYTLSWPYRLFESIFHDPNTSLVLMRIINIGLVVLALVVFRKLLIKGGLSTRVANLSTAVFVMIPMVSIVAAELNYDNAVLLAMAGLMLYVLKLAKEQLRLKTVVLFVVIGMLGSLLKTEFLVLFGLTTLFVIAAAWPERRTWIGLIAKDLKHSSKLTLIGLATLLVIVSGLFIERHGVNLVKYHTTRVDCAAVQSVQSCLSYSPWRRNYLTSSRPQANELFGNPVSFGVHWVTTMARGYIAIFANLPRSNSGDPDPNGHYVFKPVLPVLFVLIYVAVPLGLVCVVLQYKKLLKNRLLVMTAFLSASLLGTLLIFNYASYRSIGRPYAIQARYTLPILLPLIALFVEAIRQTIKSKKQRVAVMIIVLGLLFTFGGIIGWVIRAEPDWYRIDAPAKHM